MKQLLQKPFLIAFLAAFIILVLCLFVPIPIYDGIFSYHQNLVQFKQENKIALSYFLGIGMEQTRILGILPESITFKPMGYFLLIIVHIGLPTLIGLRFHFSKQKQEHEGK